MQAVACSKETLLRERAVLGGHNLQLSEDVDQGVDVLGNFIRLCPLSREALEERIHLVSRFGISGRLMDYESFTTSGVWV